MDTEPSNGRKRPGRKPKGTPRVPLATREQPNPNYVLTWRQRKILRCITESVQSLGYPPSMREIGEMVGLASTSSVAYQLTKLQAEGFIVRDSSKPRTIEVRLPGQPSVRYDPEAEAAAITTQAHVFVPLVGRIAAGVPVTAEQQVDDIYPLPRAITGDGELFVLQVAGDSMIGAAIADGDLIVIRQQADAENGEIIAALVGGEATVKTLKRDAAGRTWLVPSNPAYTPILLDGPEDMIMGKMTALIRKM